MIFAPSQINRKNFIISIRYFLSFLTFVEVDVDLLWDSSFILKSDQSVLWEQL